MLAFTNGTVVAWVGGWMMRRGAVGNLHFICLFRSLEFQVQIVDFGHFLLVQKLEGERSRISTK